MINLIPQPKVIEEREGFAKYKTIKPKDWDVDYRIKKAIEKLPCSDDGMELEIVCGNTDDEAYILNILSDRIVIISDGARGVFYGVQTLRQIFENEEIPCMYIEDCPDFKYRGVYHDVTRGKIPKLETIKKLIDDIASFKVNSFQIYVEHAFNFKEYEGICERTGYITADEIKEIDRYCGENFIEFIPSLATFGHLYELLQSEKYKHLCVLENFEQEHIFWRERADHHTIDPQNPESFEVIKSLLDQYMPLFTSDKFNICCDETFDLKTGKHRDKNTGKLYLDFVEKIINYVESKGKKVMMWGDVLHEHPECIESLSDDVILLNWAYMDYPPKEKIERFKNLNRTQIVCPGTSGWHSLCERLDQSIPNITNMTDYAYEYEADGVLNTNWGDYGNPCSIELAMYGLTYGAERSWNVKTKTEEFEEKLDRIVYKHKGATEYIKRISELHKMAYWREFVHCYSNKLFEDKLEANTPDKDTIFYVQEECGKIVKELESQSWELDDFRIEMLIAAEGTQVLAELYAKYLGFDVVRITDTKAWLNKFTSQWKKKNREYELCEIEKMFEIMEA